LEVVSNDVNTIVQVRVMGQDFAPTGEPRDRTDHQQTVAFAKLGASSLDHERSAVRRRNHFGVLVELFAHCSSLSRRSVSAPRCPVDSAESTGGVGAQIDASLCQAHVLGRARLTQA
jgi:hypothetical protein